MSDPNAAGDFVWQWLRLPFGQTILAKRRAGVLSEIGAGQLPMSSRAAKVIPMRSNPELPLPPATRTSHSAGNGNGGRQGSPLSIGMSKTADRLDLWTDQVIQSDFDDRVLGQLLNRYIDEKGSIEAAASFAAIVAKAKLSRQRREMRR